MESMRKFLVTYRRCSTFGVYDFDSIVITLDKGEKANLSTFERKLKGKPLGFDSKVIMSWSLIEE